MDDQFIQIYQHKSVICLGIRPFVFHIQYVLLCNSSIIQMQTVKLQVRNDPDKILAHCHNPDWFTMRFLKLNNHRWGGNRAFKQM